MSSPTAPEGGTVDDLAWAAALDYQPAPADPGDLRIGVIGAGFIARDIHLAAYAEAGYPVTGIASRTPARAQEVATQWGIPRVYADWRELLADPAISIVDVAYPPHLQAEIVAAAVRETSHLRGLLLQKPIATNLADAAALVRQCDDAGLTVAVNQNMRYDQSIRALHALLRRGDLGTPVIAQITMHARPHWQEFLRDYDRLALLNMSVHHLDALRFLFGDPARVFSSVRTDPRTEFPHRDGMAITTLEWEDGLRAVSIDNTFTWADPGIEWRVEGTAGMAKGTIGWPDYPAGSPSTIDVVHRATPDRWYRPRWPEQWFPQAFIGTMGQLLTAVNIGMTPACDGADNLRTMALIEAAYQSAASGQTVAVAPILAEAGIA